MTQNQSDIIEWMTAATGIGVYGIDSYCMIRIDYDGFQTKKLRLENSSGCFATTNSEGNKIYEKDSDRDFNEEVPLSSIECSAYNNTESEEMIKNLVYSFLKKTGIIKMKVHVVKKIFASNFKVSIGVLIEEIKD